MGNCHIYEEHLESMKEQIGRTPKPFPSVILHNVRKTIDEYMIDDFSVVNYESHPTIRMKMVA
jgi:thymidylate synthase